MKQYQIVSLHAHLLVPTNTVLKHFFFDIGKMTDRQNLPDKRKSTRCRSSKKILTKGIDRADRHVHQKST